MKGKMVHRDTGGRFARGGSIVPGIERANSKPAAKSAPAPQSGHKAGGSVHGKNARHRLDKRARGGRMTPSSPMSGASVKALPFAKAHLRAVDDGGKGKDK